MKLSRLLTICLLVACPLAASVHQASVAELVDLAMQNSPETKKAWSNAQRAAAYEASTKSKYYPELDLDLQAKKGKEFKYINGPDTRYTEVGADLTLSMLLFDFGERQASVASAKWALKAANWEADFALQKVLIAVLEDAYNMLHAQEILQADLLTLEDAKKLLDFAKEMHKAGLAPISDLYTSQATYSEMQMDVAKHRSEAQTQKGKLLAAIGVPYNASFEVAPIDKLPQPKLEDLEELLKRSKSKHAELIAKQAKIKEAAFEVDRVEASFLPKLKASATGGFNHYVHDATKSANYQVALDLNVPLFSGFESVYKARVAKADVQTSMQELAIAELQIGQEVLSSLNSLQAALDMLSMAEDSVKNSQLAYEGTLEKYRAGQKNMIQEVSLALHQLAKARVKLHDVKTLWLVSMAKLAFATGSLAPKDLP